MLGAPLTAGKNIEPGARDLALRFKNQIGKIYTANEVNPRVVLA
jgi:hypothetical protein